ncbi:hypothetical protein BDZ89DRAFT_530027 [Hymenopellis radicata]|nr:hypothetical protein BDZ89DRAFT_530027 [Hymenopellis radicata]
MDHCGGGGSLLPMASLSTMHGGGNYEHRRGQPHRARPSQACRRPYRGQRRPTEHDDDPTEDDDNPPKHDYPPRTMTTPPSTTTGLPQTTSSQSKTTTSPWSTRSRQPNATPTEGANDFTEDALMTTILRTTMSSGTMMRIMWLSTKDPGNH